MMELVCPRQAQLNARAELFQHSSGTGGFRSPRIEEHPFIPDLAVKTIDLFDIGGLLDSGPKGRM